jgi:hypothetical protein
LVALDIEMSAPSSSGRCASGVASVLSTASSAPAACTSAAQRREVEHVERGVRRHLDPHERRAVADRLADRVLLRRHELHVDAGRTRCIAATSRTPG